MNDIISLLRMKFIAYEFIAYELFWDDRDQDYRDYKNRFKRDYN